MKRIDTGLNLRSNKLAISGDFRLRARVASTTSGHPYSTSHQETTRARVRLDYDVNEYAHAVVEFNFSEVWAGAEPYSDAFPTAGANGIASRQSFNGLAQAYVQTEDLLGFEEKLRIGRSTYFLANGLILGSCDFLQYPATFTGAWLSRKFAGHDVEVFMLDNYGPLQSQLAGGGERYFGATGRLNFCESGPVQTLNAYYLAGTNSGDFKGRGEDWWYGLEGTGTIPGGVEWAAQFGHREVSGGKDVSAYRFSFTKKLDVPVLRSVAFTRTDSEGALHINPADFNAAGLLHQYAGPWRSDLDTNQLAIALMPGGGVDLKFTVLTLDHRGPNGAGINRQLGELEFDLLAAKELRPGVHLSLGYGIDNDQRQVGYLQMSVFF
ncbi:MAG: hypothetical protein KDC87_13705 [Planctomycetes bacterium]|nr:hypothetical protein [Planctomycetota bacterium]MCB9889833.1 hypothetical protein [Planctomycetota bacterium]